LLHNGATAQTANQVPTFRVDPLWPKLLPNGWVIGATIGIAVDSRNHVWVIHRPSTIPDSEKPGTLKIAYCCFVAPQILEFDRAGNLVSHFGGPGDGYEWPDSEHGIFVDYKNNVWIGGNGPKDDNLLKFTRQGKFLLQIGRKGHSKGSNDPQNVHSAANMEVDPSTNELIVADGYGNKRVVVFDADSGQYKRHWGAYGNTPDDTPLGPYDPAAKPAQQFRGPVHCASISKQGLIYVCDRTANRIQVFQKNGTFVRETFLSPKTLGVGAVWDIAFSPDPSEQFLYSGDGQNNRVDVLLRAPLQHVAAFGQGGHIPGTFQGLHNIAVDSNTTLSDRSVYERCASDRI
jgi:DNA-binding beta-propeller fold protein YncE